MPYSGWLVHLGSALHNPRHNQAEAFSSRLANGLAALEAALPDCEIITGHRSWRDPPVVCVCNYTSEEEGSQGG